MKKSCKVITYSVLAKGRVQGIGFRPFVYNQALKLNLTGFVKNTKQGVLIVLQGKNSKILIEILKKTPPILSKITKLSINISKMMQFNGFFIQKSAENYKSAETVEIMPDMATCPDCRKDIINIKNRRYSYPFTNCTQCGPRYSIIKTLPYDRPRTTMKIFKMCENCQTEYENPTDRRFHAQPNACPVCGPKLRLTDLQGNTIIIGDSRIIIKKTQELLTKGKIVAIRSIGGFQIACDARNNNAVKSVRIRKNRPFKPMAIMCKDIKTARLICKINKNEEKILKSQISPIVLLQKRKNTLISEQIAPKNNCFGIMLPYTPLHKLLFANVSRETLPDILVMTSANPKGAPIIADFNQVQLKLNKVVDYVLDHNRPIESRCDDSIVFDYKGPVIVRYSRGYVPEPLILDNIRLRPVLAFGSDLKNSFALGQGNKVYLSPYIGDLISGDSIAFLFEMLEKYQKWFNIKPEIVACDLHPDYISVRLAQEYAKKHRIKVIGAQHHYAHLAGVMAENGLTKPVIGLGFDGTGYGTDGQIWGSEIMKLDLSGFDRLSYLKYMPLAGGDVATTNPRLIAKTYLSKIRNSKFDPELSSGRNSGMIMTSSMARLFDAVASILGVCHKQTFEGEAPIGLEAEAMKARRHKIPYSIFHVLHSNLIDPHNILQEIIKMKKSNCIISDIAMHFHQRIISEILSRVIFFGDKYKIKVVCGSGGVFQNRIVLQGIEHALSKQGFKFYVNRRTPVNDGGISFGQAVVAGQK
ncbi:MAG: carbamoyltransferase HypF [Candidatus Latescibacteria bacterium]|nr:carbamoyltransferase HypF [Candidatus Latescibacterota bacterium]